MDMNRAQSGTSAATSPAIRLKPVVIALAMTFGMTVGEAARAANYTVVNLNDAGAGSLRQAILDANTNPGADTITFGAGVTGTITLTTGELAITDSVTLQGPGPNVLAISGNDASRVLNLYSGAALLDVTISGLTISHGAASTGAGIVDYDENLTLDNVVLRDNKSTSDGGGLWADGFNMTLTIRNSVITGNTSGQDGGGIYVEDTGGTLLIQNSTISNNQAARHGGGIYFYDPDHDITIEGSTISGNVAGQRGGGIYLYNIDGSTNTFTIRNSSITGNRAQSGGGIYLDQTDYPVIIENTTISGNTATADGGGLNARNSSSGGLSLVNVTLADNTAGGKGGGFIHQQGTSALTNVLVAGNRAASLADGNDIYNSPGAVLNVQNSLVQDAPAGTINGTNVGNLLSVAPLLGPLQNNGGLTQTHALLSGSPAIDAGASVALTTDQRGAGFPRTVGASPDIGAFEQQPPPPVQPAQPVPTLSHWALALLAGMLGFAARRRRKP